MPILSTFGATIYVDDACPGPGTGDGSIGNPYCLIQDAIDTAVSGVDEVVVLPGDYFETIDFIGKAITVRSSEGPGVTMINGFGSDTVVRCISGEGPDTILEGLTIAGGSAPSGGGMLNINSAPTVTDCVFGGNESWNHLNGYGGGGMYNENSHPTVTGCAFDGNAAEWGGGAIFNTLGSAPTLMECSFTGNRTLRGKGGAIYNRENSTVLIADCDFKENSSSDEGGAIFCEDCELTIRDCSFEKNTGNVRGGALSSDRCQFSVADSVFKENHAPSGGGGIYSFDSSPPTIPVAPTITNCSFDRNTSNEEGGGMHLETDDPTIINCTFSGNAAKREGGGIYTNGHSSAAILNSIFWGNVGDSDGNAGGPYIDEAAQIHDTEGLVIVSFSDVLGGWTGSGTDNINTDPLFVDSANGDLHLSAGSPCIDTGDNASVPVEVTTDLDGLPRIVRCVDMGAYEHPIPAGPPADRDCDGDVDGVDFAVFASCFNGAGNPPRIDGCEYESPTGLDFDNDGDVDGVDFSTFASCFNKAGNPPRTSGCPSN